MYAYDKIGLDPAVAGRLKNFFQDLTQAVDQARSLRNRGVAARDRSAQER